MQMVEQNNSNTFDKQIIQNTWLFKWAMYTDNIYVEFCIHYREELNLLLKRNVCSKWHYLGPVAMYKLS